MESVKARGRYGFYGGDGKVNKKMVIMQTGMTSCGGVMLYHGWVYQRRQGMTEWIVSKQCDVMDVTERWVTKNSKRVTVHTGMTSYGVIMWSTDGYIGANKERRSGQCQSTGMCYGLYGTMVRNRDARGMVQKGRTNRGMVAGV